MSLDITIKNKNGDACELDYKHHLIGGTYAMGGTDVATLNVTYNYSPFYAELWDGKTLTSLDGMKTSDVTLMLAQAILKLGTQMSSNYWDATPGNAGKALSDLLVLCCAFPDGTLEVI